MSRGWGFERFHGQCIGRVGIFQGSCGDEGIQGPICRRWRGKIPMSCVGGVDSRANV